MAIDYTHASIAPSAARTKRSAPAYTYIEQGRGPAIGSLIGIMPER
jgi:hypothetical protein